MIHLPYGMNQMIDSFRTSLISLLAISSVIASPSEAHLRTEENFNHGWKFLIGDHPEALDAAYDDQSWQSIGLPHSFSTPYFMSPDFYTGYGWYRKTFDVPASWSGKKISLEFEAAFQDAEIYINGVKAGRHLGGYSGFPIDITAQAKPGKNVVAIRLNNLWKSNLAPRAGEHTFSGGLYRNVRIVATDPLHVTWYGTFITTPQVTASSASVRVQTEVINQRQQPVSSELRTVILNPSGNIVGRSSSKRDIPAGATFNFDQAIPPIASPQLWDIGKPNLYRAVSQIYLGDQPVDRYETTFGIRSIQWTQDKGFFLNGRHVYITGANVHQDQAGWGDAITNAAHRRDVAMMKEAGFNFLRGSHYPPAPAKTRACDELGMLYWAENCFWGTGGTQQEGIWSASAYPIHAEDEKPFEESVKQSLTAMIRVHRNHPSIIAWSMSNEPFFSDRNVMPKVASLLKDLVALSHQLDPTRPAAVGGAQRPIDDASRIDRIGDIAGYNGDGASIPAFQNPGNASLVSEYGSVTADRPGKYEPNWGDLDHDKGKPVHDWRAGQAIWCGFDHGSIAGMSLAKMGIVDYFRLPKRAWYWYRNEYTGVKPPTWPEAGIPAALKLTSDKTTGILTDGTDDTQLIVTVTDAAGKPISNSPPVELRVISGPGEFPTGSSIRFEERSDIRIQDGKAAISIRSSYAGASTITATSPGLKGATLKLEFKGDHPYIEGKTPKVTERPYVRFDKSTQVSKEATYGPNNPTFASSSAPSSAPGLAADADPATAWKADPSDTAPAITLDTEKGLAISKIQLDFPDATARAYRVEVSSDRSTWTLVTDKFTTPETAKNADIPTSTKGRYVRVNFPKTDQATLSEIRVTGIIAE
jgi:beta-galactosidase